MASCHELENSYLGPHVLVTRTLTFVLSILSLTFWAYTLSIYNSRIAPTDGLPALDDSLLTTNSVPIVPLTISILWAFINLIIFVRRVSRRERDPTQPLSRPLVRSGWVIGIDGLIWVFMIVVMVIAGTELDRWHKGDEDRGIGGHKQVNLADCPIINPKTGLLEYYCTKDWNNLVHFQSVALSLMGPVIPMHFIIFCCAIYDLRQLRRRRRVAELRRRLSASPAVTYGSTTSPSTLPKKFEEHVELSRLSAKDGVQALG